MEEKREHAHKCLSCNLVWWHVRDTNVPKEVYQERHQCARCQKDCSFVYQHAGEPEAVPGLLDLALRCRELALRLGMYHGTGAIIIAIMERTAQARKSLEPLEGVMEYLKETPAYQEAA